MPKKIDVNVSSLVDLKAELFRKSEEKRRKVCSGSLPSTSADDDFFKARSLVKKPLLDKEKQVRKAVDKEVKHKKAEALNEAVLEEERRLQLSKNSLEAKAKLYNKLCSGEILHCESENDDNSGCLVNFSRKIQEETANDDDDCCSDTEIAEESGIIEEEQWVDYIDSLGRIRRCTKKDLPAFLEADKRLLKPPPEESQHCGTSDSKSSAVVVSPSPAETHFLESGRDNEGTETDTNTGPVHYQHVVKDEAREHGVAYMKFSTDEAVRQEQMKNLDALRKQTIESRSRNDKLKEKRRQIMTTRLAKVRERKKIRLAEGQVDPLLAYTSDDEEDSEQQIGTTDVAAIPLPEEMKEIEKESKELERERKRLSHVRPWDRDKKPMSQEAWIKQKREERPQEFAPPTFYS